MYHNIRLLINAQITRFFCSSLLTGLHTQDTRMYYDKGPSAQEDLQANALYSPDANRNLDILCGIQEGRGG